jgi:hypothetical protein
MMKSMIFIVVIVSLINIASAFQRPLGFRTTSILSANKLDGIVIAGDLTPLANNLLIKVKEAAASTAGE